MFREVRTQSEDLDFLGALRAGSQKAQIIQAAALGRALVENRVGKAGEVGFAQEGGDHGGDQEDQKPGRKHDQAGGKRDQGEHVLADIKKRSEQPEPAGGLAAGTLEFVVKHRVFELRQVEPGGVLHEFYADAIGEAIAEQAVAEGVGSAEEVAGDGQSEFERNQLPDAGQIAGSPRNPAHHGVNDEFGDPEHSQRQERPQKPENDGRQNQGRAGIPHHAQQGSHIPQRRSWSGRAGWDGCIQTV